MIFIDNTNVKNMNRKNTIRLTESELKNIVIESVKKILNETTVNDIERLEKMSTRNEFLRSKYDDIEPFHNITLVKKDNHWNAINNTTDELIWDKWYPIRSFVIHPKGLLMASIVTDKGTVWNAFSYKTGEFLFKKWQSWADIKELLGERNN